MLRFIGRCWRGELEPPISVRPLSIILLIVLIWLLAVFFLLPRIVAGYASPPPKSQLFIPPTTQGPQFGLNFISAATSDGTEDERYRNGLATGVAWNRWPIHWSRVEQLPEEFDWAAVDTAVIGDVSHGLQSSLVLLGTPDGYTTAVLPPDEAWQEIFTASSLALTASQTAVPVGLNQPIFADGTDLPGVGKPINPNNPWARFVFTAVSRYRPGGALAQSEGWVSTVGVTHWEIWNEPDLALNWSGNAADYAQLLKVASIAARHADPAAQIIFGGLANSAERPNFYDTVLRQYDGDAQAVGQGYYHQIAATHNYLYAARSATVVADIRTALANRGLQKPIWLNETGVPVWNDYPGPVCTANAPFQATMQEQASFMVQSALHAAYARADNIFFFQLYDQCGNQPADANFDYYDVSACSLDGSEPVGEAYGLLRNPSGNSCFNDHPSPDAPRPSFTALQTLTTYFVGVQPLWQRVDGQVMQMVFQRPQSRELVIGLWVIGGEGQTAVVPATSSKQMARLVTMDGMWQDITAVDGFYHINLPGATNQNAPWDAALYPIGGEPVLLIESSD